MIRLGGRIREWKSGKTSAWPVSASLETRENTMPGWLTPIVRHFAGGDALFAATALICLAAICRRAASDWIQRNASRLAILGLIWFWLSATPLPVWGTAALSLLTIWAAISSRPAGVAAAENAPSTQPGCHRMNLSVWNWTLLPLIWLAVAGWELTCRRIPEIPHAPRTPVIIIGDSISAGLGEGEGATCRDCWRNGDWKSSTSRILESRLGRRCAGSLPNFRRKV